MLLLVAKVFGEIFHHFGFSAMIGEVLAGVLLGPAVLGLFSQSAYIETVAMLGLLILMLVSGMNSRFELLKTIRLKSAIISLFGVCVSLGLGALAGYLWTGDIFPAIFIGAVLSNTATEVVVRFTSKSSISHLVTAAALIDDIIAVYILGLVSTSTIKQALGLPTDPAAIAITTVGIIAFFILTIYLSKLVIIRLDVMKRLWKHKGRGIPVTFAMVLALLFAVVARYVGMHEIIGAYMAGLFIGRLREKPDALLLGRIRLNALLDDMGTVMQGVLTPFFFAYVGLLFPQLGGINLLMLLAFTAVAFGGKIAGAGMGALIVGLRGSESLKVGVAMCARGSLELAMLQFGRVTGIISLELYSVMVVMVLLTALLTPVIFRLLR
ncbi:MAG: cation:proton antiporter [Candidatus Hadarchaeales archaeon]